MNIIKNSWTWSNVAHTANFDGRLDRMLIRPLSLPWRGSESAQSRSLGWQTSMKMRRKDRVEGVDPKHEASRSSRQTLRDPRVETQLLDCFHKPRKKRTTNHPASSQDYLSKPLPNRVEITQVTAKSVREELPEAAAGMSQLASVHLKAFKCVFKSFPWTDVRMWFIFSAFVVPVTFVAGACCGCDFLVSRFFWLQPLRLWCQLVFVYLHLFFAVFSFFLSFLPCIYLSVYLCIYLFIFLSVFFFPSSFRYRGSHFKYGGEGSKILWIRPGRCLMCVWLRARRFWCVLGPAGCFPCSKFYICIYVSFLPVETCIF